MENYYLWRPPPPLPLRRQSCEVSLSTGVLVLGVVGGTLGVAALVAYGIVQPPTIRGQFGSYFNTTSQNDADSIHKIAYSLEIIGVVVGGVLGILSNVLLIYGVIKSKRWYLVHWLIFHVVLIAVGIAASLLIILLQRDLSMLFAVIPVTMTAIIIFSWIKVYQLFCLMEPKTFGTCKVHSREYLNSSVGELDWIGPRYGKMWIPPPKQDDRTEFYPQDTLTKSLQERLYETPWWDTFRRPSTEYRENIYDNTYIYYGSESTESSIVPFNHDKKASEYDYPTMPSTAAICHHHEPQQLTLNVHHHENRFCQQCGQNAPNSTEEVHRVIRSKGHIEHKISQDSGRTDPALTNAEI